ncbi:CRAL/TRIO domain-containing protein [Parathielavia appendiculata]|uniref:CRAL/TRIO domain-containing protein n=1 Tax=Parathielavia appendiculata TaxID=2587402 RepID=A0AAN6Z5Y5_9PEZI|nr:CRAL/TRIO domain-containing protein [Parathielavia appendiculata]
MAEAQAHRTVSVGGHDIGYPHGHLGYLTQEEENSLESFKVFLQEKGLYTRGPPASHDDQTLLRFLRARRWIVKDAYGQFKDTEEWRQANQLEVLYDTIDVDAYEQTRRLYPQWTGRRDRRGIPLYLFQIRHLDSKTVSTYEKSAESTNASKAQTDGSTPQRLLRLFALYENLTRFAQPLCTEMMDREHPRTPITLSTNIVDVSQVSLRMFWNLKAHMQAASTLATAHYPETLDRIFIIGAPYFFSTVWGWIKRWFDPITVSKIFILSASEVKTTLEEFIEPRNIPKLYGGELEFEFFDRPNLDPQIKEVLIWENGYTDFPEGPAYWVPVDGGKRLACIAVGSKGGKERRETVCTIPVAFPKEGVTAPTETAVSAPAPAADATVQDAVEGVEKLSIANKVANEMEEKVAVKAQEPQAATTAT